MHGPDYRPDAPVREGEEPSDAPALLGTEVKAEDLHQHDVSEMLRDQRAARSPVAELRGQLVERPAQNGGLRGGATDVHDRRQCAEQDRSMIAGEGKATADKEEIPAAVAGRDPVFRHRAEERLGVHGRQRRVRGEHERAALRQEEAVSLLDVVAFRFALNRNPARSAHDRIEFDAVGGGEAERPVAARIQPRGDVAPRLQQGKDV